MTDYAFRKDVHVSDLSDGASLFLMTFRGLAFAGEGCQCLKKVYENQFGEHASTVLRDIQSFIRVVGSSGQRRVRLAQPGCGRITHDEVSLLAIVNAAQDYDHQRLDSYLCWLLKASHTGACVEPATRVANWFSSIGLSVLPPENVSAAERIEADQAVFGIVGRA